MEYKPLLVFPRSELASRSSLPSGGNRVITPNLDRQSGRLDPQFMSLQTSFENERIRLQNYNTGIDPELVLVFEIVDTISEFNKALSRIEGFEYLNEIEIDEIESDSDFYYTDKRNHRLEKSLTGRLYFVFTNNRALQELLSLWTHYSQGNLRVFTRGLAKFKNLFKLLKTVRPWNATDRLLESNVIQYWEENLLINPTREINFEIELWYRSNQLLREQSYHRVSNLINSIGGNIITSCLIEEIQYHAILAKLPAIKIKEIIETRDTELVRCENIMFFKPTGQSLDLSFTDSVEFSESINENENDFPSGEPIIGILDGFPLQNHALLRNRLKIDDPEGFESDYAVEDRKHGTAMCSLIVNGDLTQSFHPLKTPLYVRPIMKPNLLFRDHNESVPQDELFVDLIHRSIKRMFESYGDNNPPTAKTVKIINLSICESDKPFFNTLSPCSKLLDFLSYKFDVLFIISTGNWQHDINFDSTPENFNSLSPLEKDKAFLNYIVNDRRNRRILSPSESINNLTVGSIHDDNSILRPNEARINPYSCQLPSLYTSIGGGYRRSIKPDLVYPGGRQFCRTKPGTNLSLSLTRFISEPGHKVARSTSNLNETCYSVGTSNSAALISRSAHGCYETLMSLIDNYNINYDDSYTAVILKTMLIHGCSWDTIGENIQNRINNNDARFLKTIKSNLLGYGIPDFEKIIQCSNTRATILGFGQLKQEQAHIYSLPLPPSLSSKTIKRRLTVTLAGITSTSANTYRYRNSRLWFEAANSIADRRLCYDDKAVKRGTIQHEIFEGQDASAYVDGAVIRIKVNCSADAAINQLPTKYCIIVSLEVAQDIDIPIYEEIKNRLRIPLRAESSL